LKLHRDENGLLRGDLDYGVGFPATVMPEITPIVFPCTSCAGITLHISVQQPTGLGFKLPFMRKPLASLSKDYGLVCNVCATTTGISGKRIIDLLQYRIAPPEVCDAIDRFCHGMKGAVPAFSEGFTAFVAELFDDDKNLVAACTSVYSRPNLSML
jgi:hypothetical protein